MSLYAGEDIDPVSEDYPLLTKKTHTYYIYNNLTAKAFMLTGVDKTVRLKLSEGSQYTLERFSPAISKKKVAQYYGIDESDVEDLTQRAITQYASLNDSFLFQDDYYKVYAAPIAYSNTLAYILIARHGQSVYWLTRPMAGWYATDVSAFNGTSLNYWAAVQTTVETLASICGSLDYLIPFTYNGDENKIYLDYSVSAASETEQDEGTKESSYKESDCCEETNLQEDSEMQ